MRLKSIWFKWLVALFCIIAITAYIISHWNDTRIIFNISITSFCLIMLFHLIFLIIHSYRYRLVVMKCGNQKIPFLSWFNMVIVSRVLNKFIPQAGNLYRAYQLKKDHEMSYSAYASAYLFFTWFDTLINFTIASILVYLVVPDLELYDIKLLPLLFALSTTIFILPVLINALFNLIKIGFNHNGKLCNVLNKMNGVYLLAKMAITDFRLILSLFILGLFSFCFMSLRIYIAFTCFSINYSLSLLALFYAVYKLSILVVITPGNLGIQELSFGVLTALTGEDTVIGFMAAAMLRLMGYILFLFIVLMSIFFREKIRK